MEPISNQTVGCCQECADMRELVMALEARVIALEDHDIFWGSEDNVIGDEK